jgi:polyhydroxybutyrate depolymerase
MPEASRFAAPPAAPARPTAAPLNATPAPPDRPTAATLAALALVAASACSTAGPAGNAAAHEPSTGPSAPPSASAPTATPPTSPLVVARPYRLDAPPAGGPAKPAPLLLLLHPLGVTGAQFADLIGVRALPREKGFLLAYPDGKVSRGGKTFWKATESCCDFHSEGDDDVAYLAAVIDDVKAKHAVDPARVYVVGYSNGGFMAQRLACDLPGIAAIVDLSGAAVSDPATCQPKNPVAVLEIHGDKDKIVPYEGGLLGVEPKTAPVPSARAGALAWAARNGCHEPIDRTAGPFDFAADVEGSETTVERWAGCRGRADVELWTVRGAGHVFRRTPAFAPAVIDFLVAHPRAQ